MSDKPIPETSKHEMNCAGFDRMQDCTCGLEWRVKLTTAEAALSEAREGIAGLTEFKHELQQQLNEAQQERDRWKSHAEREERNKIGHLNTLEEVEQQVTQQAATISQCREFLEAIVIAFKEPDGGPYWKLRAFAESQGIYADDLGRDRVMLRIAQAALANLPTGEPKS